MTNDVELGSIPSMKNPQTPPDEPTWKRKIRQVVAEMGGVGRTVSLGAGRNETWVRDILAKGSNPKASSLEGLARYSGRPVSWFFEDEGEAPPSGPSGTLEEPTRIPVDENGLPMAVGFHDGWKPKLPGGSAQIDAEAGTGEGSVGDVLAIESRGIVSGHRVTDEWVVPRSVLGANPSNIIIIPVVGTSMEPSLTATDLVFVDRTATNVRAGEVYVIDEGDGPMAKRVRIDRSEDPATLIIISENPAVPPYPRPAESIRIIGRVVGKYCKM